MTYIITMLGLMAGCYFWIINAAAVSHAIRKWTGPVRDPATLARRFGFRRTASAYSMRSPE